MKCRHIGEILGTVQTPFGLEPQYRCRHRRHQEVLLGDCLLCEDFAVPVEQLVIPGQPDSSGCAHPTGVVVDRYNRDCNIADLFLGAQCFLVLGGPSTKTLPLHLLSRRGVLIMSCNNSMAVLPEGIRPHIWCHTDPTGKFHDSIWRDPGIPLKFTPVREWNRRNPDKKQGIRHRVNGKLVPLEGLRAHDMPSVLGFHRNTSFGQPLPSDAPKGACSPVDDWLWEATVNRGNDEQSAWGTKTIKGEKVKVQEPNGWPKTINTMFCAIRIAFYLGIKTLYLVGADFHMDPDEPYAFGQGKSPGGVRANNSAFQSMAAMFDGLLPHFEQAGFQVFNCSPGSHLWTFKYVPFEEAVARATDDFEQILNTEGWYDDPERDSDPGAGGGEPQAAAGQPSP